MGDKPEVEESGGQCPCCALRSMIEGLDDFYELIIPVAQGVSGEAAEYKANQLAIACNTAENAVRILRDLFLEFGEDHLPETPLYQLH